MKHRNLILAVLCGLLLVNLLPFGIITAEPAVQTTSETLSAIDVTITFANYTDLDDDGFQDDVYATVDVSLFNGETYTFDYYVKLTLPSGLAFNYLYIITTNYQSFTIHNYFWDHATESGWYQLDVSVKLHTGGGQTDETTLVFDPPGGSSGGDPEHGTFITS